MTRQFTVITLFPEIFDSFCASSLIGKSIESGSLQIHRIDIRDFSADRHRSVDDAPYGGGAGMVLMPGPVVSAIRAAGSGHRVLLTPQGRRFDQSIAHEMARHPSLILICGRYEGYDERIRRHVDDELSLGDFILNGGEVAAMAIIESIVRLGQLVIGNPDSTQEESFSEGLLEYPQYTRPRDFEGESVPDVLLGGNHAQISSWRRRQRLARTLRRRPDLLREAHLSDEDRAVLRDLAGEAQDDE